MTTISESCTISALNAVAAISTTALASIRPCTARTIVA